MRLELTRRGDYGVRAMLILAAPDAGQMTAAQLAAATEIPPNLVAPVMGDLVRAGLVANRRGRTGGYRLAMAPSKISLLDVITAVEGDPRRTTCVLRGGPCGRNGTCAVHDTFFRAQDAVLHTLADVSLDLVAG